MTFWLQRESAIASYYLRCVLAFDAVDGSSSTGQVSTSYVGAVEALALTAMVAIGT